MDAASTTPSIGRKLDGMNVMRITVTDDLVKCEVCGDHSAKYETLKEPRQYLCGVHAQKKPVELRVSKAAYVKVTALLAGEVEG